MTLNSVNQISAMNKLILKIASIVLIRFKQIDEDILNGFAFITHINEVEQLLSIWRGKQTFTHYVMHYHNVTLTTQTIPINLRYNNNNVAFTL